MEPPRLIELWLPGARPASLNRTNGHHWTGYYKRKEVAFLEVRGAGTPPAHPLRRCTITYINKYGRLPLDWDNLGASFKPYGDALIKNGYIEDDAISCVKSLHLGQEKVTTVKKEGILIWIRPQP